MGKTGVHVISKNVNYRRDGFKRLKILEKDQEIPNYQQKTCFFELELPFI